MTPHALVLCDPFGIQYADIRIFANLDVTRKEGDYGEMVLDLFPDFNFKWLKRDWRIEDWRNGKLFGESSFIVRHIKDTTDSNGVRIFRVWAYDSVSLLKRHSIPYNNGTTYTEKQGPADDVLKAIVRENFGSLALDTARDISSVLSVEIDKGLAPQVTKFDFAYRNVLALLQEICNDSRGLGTYLTFDLVWVNGTQWEFRTYINQRGIDHSSDSAQPVIITEGARNLAQPEYDEDGTDEANYVYSLGQSAGNARARGTAYDNARIGISPYGRIEGTVDASNTADATALTAEANSYLQLHRVKQTFNGKLQDSDGAIFGVDYDFGDLVTVQSQRFSFDCHVDAVHAVVNRDNQEQLDVFAKSENYVY